MAGVWVIFSGWGCGFGLGLGSGSRGDVINLITNNGVEFKCCFEGFWKNRNHRDTVNFIVPFRGDFRF